MYSEIEYSWKSRLLVYKIHQTFKLQNRLHCWLFCYQITRKLPVIFTFSTLHLDSLAYHIHSHVQYQGKYRVNNQLWFLQKTINCQSINFKRQLSLRFILSYGLYEAMGRSYNSCFLFLSPNCTGFVIANYFLDDTTFGLLTFCLRSNLSRKTIQTIHVCIFFN